ncbi:C40 family peptidase [Aquimarina agarilytica]|uniref:C40 family peptidase n=1 Tax=Aquimarina agarilytica TaxID=1087449 RepID=UPI0002881E60|nr:C40 family peptidase [Aquimarina agarilytica]
MQYGIAHLSMISLRENPSDTAEQTSQVLYGELFKVLEVRKNWSRIRLAYDKYEGWIDNKQYTFCEEEIYKALIKENPILSTNLVDFILLPNEQLMPVPFGVSLNSLAILGHGFDGESTNSKQPKNQLIETALIYLNSPYQWGGKTSFGIDCSGFTQMVYKINGYKLKRDASQQATQGDPLSFIEESEPGDLAFFDNAEGKITHVGIMMKDNYIIHAHGKVRIDRIDHTGIFNAEKRTHTHKLRVIKRIID